MPNVIAAVIVIAIVAVSWLAGRSLARRSSLAAGIFGGLGVFLLLAVAAAVGTLLYIGPAFLTGMGSR